MPLVYEILLEIFELVHNHAKLNGIADFLSLLEVNRAFSDIAIMVLWKELPSVDALLHLMPEDVLERSFEDGIWRYICHRNPLPAELARFDLYAPLIRAIQPDVCALSHRAVQGFEAILRSHTSRSGTPLLPRLHHLQLAYSSDALLGFIPSLLHDGLRNLSLPANGFNSGYILNCLIRTPPPLHSLVYISSEGVSHLANHLHLFPSLRHLTVPLQLPAQMEAITTHPLDSLTVIVSNPVNLPQNSITFHHPLRSFSIVFRQTFLVGGGENPSFEDAINMLHACAVRCERLKLTLPRQLGGDSLQLFIESLALRST
ncbi:hypothetical protein DFH29DRAFT_1010517 [Suillus ampliporus]|nr:hypothetical protein DFH29DRAFT_1010517 [Suillus ampliporus]